MTRSYTLKQRATRRDEVRRRIIDAAVVLKQTMAPGDISMADVAEQAGVGRVTVYRHFCDLETLKKACSQRFFSLNPPPDPSRSPVELPAVPVVEPSSPVPLGPVRLV